MKVYIKTKNGDKSELDSFEGIKAFVTETTRFYEKDVKGKAVRAIVELWEEEDAEEAEKLLKKAETSDFAIIDLCHDNDFSDLTIEIKNGEDMYLERDGEFLTIGKVK